MGFFDVLLAALRNAGGSMLEKMIPLYSLVALGYLAHRRFRASQDTLAALLIYILGPAVVFQGVLKAEITAAHLLLPVIFFMLATCICLSFLGVSRRFHRKPSTAPNILAFGAGNANSGYFGFPVAVSIFGESIVGLSVLINMGYVTYENTVGFFITARGHHSPWQSLQRVLRLPTIYAFVAALIGNQLGWKLSGPLSELAIQFRGAYSVLGMMLIGMGVSSALHSHSPGEKRLDSNFLTLAIIAKFVAWPCAMFAVVMLDRQVFHLFDPLTRQLMMLVSALPMAANTVAVAAVLKTEPSKAAMAVLITTLLAMFTVPLMVSLAPLVAGN